MSLPEKSHGQRRLVGYSPWGQKRVRHNLVTKQQQYILYNPSVQLSNTDTLRRMFTVHFSWVELFPPDKFRISQQKFTHFYLLCYIFLHLSHWCFQSQIWYSSRRDTFMRLTEIFQECLLLVLDVSHHFNSNKICSEFIFQRIFSLGLKFTFALGISFLTGLFIVCFPHQFEFTCEPINLFSNIPFVFFVS